MNLSSAYLTLQLSPNLRCSDVTSSLEVRYRPAKRCEARPGVYGDGADDGQTVGYATSLHSPDRDSDGVNSARTCRLAFPLAAGM